MIPSQIEWIEVITLCTHKTLFILLILKLMGGFILLILRVKGNHVFDVNR